MLPSSLMEGFLSCRAGPKYAVTMGPHCDCVDLNRNRGERIVLWRSGPGGYIRCSRGSGSTEETVQWRVPPSHWH
jgi:hypothetical protein